MPPLTRPALTEQERNLWILRWTGVGLLLLLGAAAVALYFGVELPPAEMRTYYTSATGYAPPPRPGAHPVGTLPRGAPPPEPVSGSAGGARAMLPAAAARRRNPLFPTPETLALGERAYRVNCGMCHGEAGRGVGPVGERYVPRPPDLAKHVPLHPSEELYAAITDGIHSTPTPEAAQYLPREWHAFRAEVPVRDRWAIVTYLQQTLGGERAVPHESHGHAAPATP